MSVQITTAFVKKFSANMSHLVQQKGSRLRNAVMSETVRGESAFFDQIGPSEAVEITSRHMDTPRVDTPHDRRRVTMKGIVWADLIDKDDEVQMLTKPTSQYAKAGMWSLGRKMDDIIVAAFDGTAFTGKEGATSTVYDTTQTVDVQIRAAGVSAADYGLNVEKILAAGEILTANEVDPEEERYMYVRASQIRSLLGDPRISSHDYNVIRPLVDGKVSRFGGFTMIPGERGGVDSNSDQKVFYWVKSGMKMGINADIESKITDRSDKNYSTQVWLRMRVGATRMEEEKVGFIECDPTAGPGA